MRTCIQSTSLMLITAILAVAASAWAAPETPPVRLEYSVPANVRTGDVVTTVITCRAVEDLDRLELDLTALEGLEIVSDARHPVFTGVKRGETRDVSVTVRLTGSKSGTLAVLYRTQQRAVKMSSAVTIVYGNPGH
jgi:hypothetical protein